MHRASKEVLSVGFPLKKMCLHQFRGCVEPGSIYTPAAGHSVTVPVKTRISYRPNRLEEDDKHGD